LAVTSESWDMQKSMTTMWENLLPAMQATALPENQTEYASLKEDINNLVLPVAKGSLLSSSTSKYKDKKYKISSNDFGVTELQFKLSKDDCKLVIKKDNAETTIKFGWENWITNKDTIVYPFKVAARLHMPSKIAGTATWINDNTLQLNCRFVEAMHGDKVTCVFDADRLSVSFLNSVAENTKTETESRKSLSGTI